MAREQRAVSTRHGSVPRRPHPAGRSGPPTVVAVDDNPATRRFVRETLEVEGYAVVEATGGTEAIETCSRRTPHLVIVDLCLRDMSGSDLIARLRTLPEMDGVPVVVFTGAPE